MYYQEDIEPIISQIMSAADPAEVLSIAQERYQSELEKRKAFYNDINPSIKAEFIEGKLITHSPARLEHLRSVKNIFTSINIFLTKKNVGESFSEKAMISLQRNDFEPDVVFFKKEKVADFKAGQMRFPAPDFVVEVTSDSTEDRDRGIKFHDYEYHKVEEYWIVNPDLKTTEQYLLKDKKYELHAKVVNEGTIHSKAIEGWSIRWSEVFG